MNNLLLGSNAQYFRYPFSDFVKAMVKENINSVDITLLAPHIYIDSFEILDPCHVVETLHIHGISVTAVTPLPYRYSICAGAGTMQREKTLGYYKQCILFAHIARAEFMLLTASGADFDIPHKILLDNAAEMLSLLSTFAEECGVTLLLGTVMGMESPLNASTPVLLTLPELKDMLERVNSPALKAYLDTAVVSLVGETIQQWFSLLGSELRLVRFTDGNYNGYRIWGTGCLPCEQYLLAISEAGFTGPLSLAVPGERYCENPSNAQSVLLSNLQVAMKKVTAWQQ